MLRNGKELHRYRVHFLAALVVAGALCSVANARLVNYVIHVSVDGLRPDAITNLGPTNLPNFYRLRSEGAFTDNARTDYDYTETLPNHTTQLTGRGVLGTAGHGWKENTDPPEEATLASNKGFYVAGVFDVAHDRGLRTGEYPSKSKFSLFDTSWNATNGALDGTPPDNGRDKIDIYVNLSDTAPLVNRLAADMETQALHYAFIHLTDPDTIGHGHGWDPTPGSAYSDTIIDMDSRLGVIFSLVTTNAQFAGRTVILLTTDHGGTGTAHANAGLAENYTIPFYVWGPGVTAGASLYDLNPTNRSNPGTGRPNYSASVQPIRNGEAANVALKLLGLPPVPGSTIGQAQDLALNASPGPAPSAPTATAATSAINCGFTAHWNSASGATGYLLDVSTDSAFSNYVSGYQDIVVGNVLSHNVTGLNASTTYYYRVWAYNLNGTSGSSGTISATTTANVSPPSTPTATAATGVTSTGFTANWSIACGATGYRLDVSTNDTFSSFVAGYQGADAGNVTSRTLSKLSASTTYYYRVRAYNGIGTSGNSGTISVTTADINWCIPGVLLGHGDMEDVDSYRVCPDWQPYSAGNGVASWTKDIIVHGGLASQRAKNINGGTGSLLGVRQTIDANVGDAFTFEGWVNPVSNPGAGQQVALVVRWDGSTADPDATASWKISTGLKNVWTHLQNLSGNATATRVTLFLDSRRKSGSLDITAYWDDVVSYRAYVPPAPSVSSAGSTSLNVDVNAGCNSTHGAAEYAVTIGGGAFTLGTNWVQADGRVGTTAVWQTDAVWATRTVTGLTTGTTYTLKTKARYSGTYTQETSLGAGAHGTPSGETPTAPTITQHPSNQTVAAGETATFTVAATGTSPLSYQWQKNRANLTNGGHYSGATWATLTISAAGSGDQANYRCVVTNSHGTATSNEASLTVGACSDPILLNGNFEGGNANGIADNWTSYARAEAPSFIGYTIPTAAPAEGFQYQQIQTSYVASGGAGVYQVLTGCVSGVTYRVRGSYRTNSASGRATVKCAPNGSTSYGSAIDLTPAASTTSSTWGSFDGAVTATASSITLFLDCQTHVSVSGNGKAAAFDGITVTITGCTPTAAPSITQHPSPQSVCPGADASLTVAATGDEPLSYQWQKNQANLANGGHYSGATSQTLTITDADAADAANYRCVVSNAGGSVNSNSAALTLRSFVVADLDQDCDVDQSDFSLFSGCTSAPGVPWNPGCETSDFDDDNDVDQSDFGILQRCYSGEGNSADPNCAD